MADGREFGFAHYMSRSPRGEVPEGRSPGQAIFETARCGAAKAARFKQLPVDGRAVTDWRSADHAFLDMTEGIRKVVKDIRRELEAQAVGTLARSRAKEAVAQNGPKATPKAVPGPKPMKGPPKTHETRPKSARGPTGSTGAGRSTSETKMARRPQHA